MNPQPTPEPDPDDEQNSSTTTVFLVSAYQYLTLATVFSKGKHRPNINPFKRFERQFRFLVLIAGLWIRIRIWIHEEIFFKKHEKCEEIGTGNNCNFI